MKRLITLERFAQKYDVSVSTLRRRYREGRIKILTKKGRYYVEDNKNLVKLFERVK